jgi:hypothetical protein
LTDGSSSADVTYLSAFYFILGNFFTFSFSICLQAAEILSKEGISAEVIPFTEDIVSLVQYN